MTLEDFSEQFDTMPRERKICLLALIALALTVETRAAVADLPTDRALKVYEGFNELQHSVTNQLCAYSRAEGSIRPNAVFWKILDEVATAFLLKDNLRDAVAWSFSRD